MNRLLLIFLWLISVQGSAQALRDINYNYLYSPEQPFMLKTSIVHLENQWKVYVELKLKDTTQKVGDYTLQHEIRTALHEKEGKTVAIDSALATAKTYLISNAVTIPHQQEALVFVSKVTNNTLKQAWYFYEILEPKYPVNAALFNGNFLVTNYSATDKLLSLTGEPIRVVSYYDDIFPAATPPFDEAMARVSAGLKVDSTFILPEDVQAFRPYKQGLYLIQKDTLATMGVAFRVHSDYPRYNRIENLADPLIYVCTKQEFDRVKAAKGDKKAFDKVMLSITQDTDRARQFVRSYFRRVELANTFFSSYKEGWKTDRGMIYIIFGLPDEVFRFSDREVWTYKDYGKLSFNFVKSPSLFDPDNYVLVRERKFQEKWYEVIDMWRNARF